MRRSYRKNLSVAVVGLAWCVSDVYGQQNRYPVADGTLVDGGIYGPFDGVADAWDWYFNATGYDGTISRQSGAFEHRVVTEYSLTGLPYSPPVSATLHFTLRGPPIYPFPDSLVAAYEYPSNGLEDVTDFSAEPAVFRGVVAVAPYQPATWYALDVGEAVSDALTAGSGTIGFRLQIDPCSAVGAAQAFLDAVDSNPTSKPYLTIGPVVLAAAETPEADVLGQVFYSRDAAFADPCIPRAPSAYVPTAEGDSLARLGRFDGVSFQVDVLPGSLDSTNLHVLVHGWGRGGDAHPGVAPWDPPVQDYALWRDLASSIVARDASADPVVLMYNWLDDAATDTCQCSAWRSRCLSDLNGARLAEAIVNAVGGLTGEIHLIGHGHGARVGAVAAWHLEDMAMPGLQVRHLTLLDSPEFSHALAGGNNELALTLDEVTIGREVGATLVDNYFSSLGRRYGRADGADPRHSIVDVELRPEHLAVGDDAGRATYPLGWYGRATSGTSDLGLAWSPLLGSGYEDLGSYHLQDDWVEGGVPDENRELVLLSESTTVFPTDRPVVAVTPTMVSTAGAVSEIGGGIELAETSAGPGGESAYWYASLEIGEDDDALSFSFEFVAPGDSDQLGVWIDEELRFVMTGSVAGATSQSATIDVRNVNAGSHYLTVALHGYGIADATVQVGGFGLVKRMDCNVNGTPDDQEISGGGLDCNVNGILDACEILQGGASDGGPFYCATGCDPDCNRNGVPDRCDIDTQTESDADGDGLPDVCTMGIPTVSQWGLAALALLLGVGGTIILRR